MSESHDIRPKKRAHLAAAAILLCSFLAAAVGVASALTRLDGDRIARGVSVDGYDIGLLTAEDAKARLDARVADIRITYSLDGETVSLDPDGERPFAAFDVASAIEAAHGVGRQAGLVRSAVARVRAAILGDSVDVPHTLDRVALRELLEERYAEQVAPPKNAGFAVDFADGEPTVTVTPEQDGIDVNYDAVMSETEERLALLSASHVNIPTKRGKPDLGVADVEPLIGAAVEAIKVAPLTLTAKNETWTVSRATFADWLVAVPDEDVPAALALDHDRLAAYLEARAAAVRTEPKNAEYEEKDGKAVTFVPSKDGESIDVEGSIAAISTAVFAGDPNDERPEASAPRNRLTLPMTAVRPEIPTEAANPYGVKEVIGRGASNFRGSPVNRRHNIAVGAKSVNGTIVPPGEEFSMIKTLGTIDGTTGYRTELVIKGNKTTPEYGGGLCQIGSTAFRAALDSGLPVTMRQNHSYRVPYYERDGDGNYIGPGKDATIYDPLPDFRFLNDTGHAIIIFTAISGDRADFTFWGVRDGRKSEQTDSRVFDVVQPPAKKIIQTTDIPVGTEKCTERAHVGSKAAFTYTVTMPDGDVRTKEFVSHYRPWQEVCLQGVDASALPPGVTSQELVTPPPTAEPVPAASAPAAATP